MTFVTELPLQHVTKCARCQRAMVPKSILGRPPRFCSTRCRMAAHRRAKALMRPNEFYTPAYVMDAVRACLGWIDLDPASCAVANETVGAAHFYSLKDDGLKRPWFGRVWLNPPFGKFGPLFVRRIVREIEEKKVSQAVLLLKVTHLGTGWFTDAVPVKHLLCFPRRRINFYSSIIKVSTATFPSVLIGIGIDSVRFKECFGSLGRIAEGGAQ